MFHATVSNNAPLSAFASRRDNTALHSDAASSGPVHASGRNVSGAGGAATLHSAAAANSVFMTTQEGRRGDTQSLRGASAELARPATRSVVTGDEEDDSDVEGMHVPHTYSSRSLPAPETSRDALFSMSLNDVGSSSRHGFPHVGRLMRTASSASFSANSAASGGGGAPGTTIASRSSIFYPAEPLEARHRFKPMKASVTIPWVRDNRFSLKSAMPKVDGKPVYTHLGYGGLYGLGTLHIPEQVRQEFAKLIVQDFLNGFYMAFSENPRPGHTMHFYLDYDVDSVRQMRDEDWDQVEALQNRVIATFFKDGAADDDIFRSLVLTSGTFVKCPAPGVTRYKAGVHVVFQRLFVTLEQALHIAGAIQQAAMTELRELGMEAGIDWEHCIDLAVYGAGRGLRWAWQLKERVCQECGERVGAAGEAGAATGFGTGSLSRRPSGAHPSGFGGRSATAGSGGGQVSHVGSSAARSRFRVSGDDDSGGLGAFATVIHSSVSMSSSVVPEDAVTASSATAAATCVQQARLRRGRGCEHCYHGVVPDVSSSMYVPTYIVGGDGIREYQLSNLRHYPTVNLLLMSSIAYDTPRDPTPGFAVPAGSPSLAVITTRTAKAVVAGGVGPGYSLDDDALKCTDFRARSHTGMVSTGPLGAIVAVGPQLKQSRTMTELPPSHPLVAIVMHVLQRWMPYARTTVRNVRVNDARTIYWANSNSRFCHNKGAEHTNSGVWFTIQKRGVVQRCFCKKHASCKKFRSAPFRLLETEERLLFGGTPLTVQEDDAEERAACDADGVVHDPGMLVAHAADRQRNLKYARKQRYEHAALNPDERVNRKYEKLTTRFIAPLQTK